MKVKAGVGFAIGLGLVFLIVLPTFSAGTVPSAQDSPARQPTDDEVNAVAKQLYCPVCENIPLDVCPTQACMQWRELIQQKLAAGWSEQQIKMYFVEQYGDRVLATPPARGLNWLVYVIPPVLILGGAVFLFMALRSWKKATPKSAPQPAEHPPIARDDYVARLEEELRNR